MQKYHNTSYLTLRSNSSLGYFPKNTAANFKVNLAEAIELIWEWEVALCEVHYPINQQTFIYKLGPSFAETGLIPDGHYNSVPDLIRKLNHCMTKEAQSKIKFSYVANKRKVKINVPKGGYVLVTGDIATMLGFQQDTVIEKETLSPYVVDVNGGFSSMYVYTDIIDVQFDGDVKVPLLRIVNTQGNYGDNVNASFCYMQYVPIKVKSFETIEINIKDDKNENVSFGFGKSIVTLNISFEDETYCYSRR